MRIDSTDIGMNNAAQIAAAGIEAIRAGDATFDLSAVRTCDSAAVAVVLAWQREAQARGAQLQLSGLPAGLASLATVYGVAPLLDLDETGR
ncbi:MAG TPA: STAS domain-containing protein [Burkholderiaceae bacterium]|nr:STAS domain-containing protein [Burkholderiaceae bacterium]